MNAFPEGSDASSRQLDGAPDGRAQALPAAGTETDTTRQLPPGGNKIERITQHSKGLVEDLTSWIELKVKLTQIEIEERIEEKVNGLVAVAIVGGLALLGAVFALITLGLGLGALFIALGLSRPLSYVLGFLIVTLILFGAAAVLRSRKPSFVHIGDKKAHVDEKKLTAPPPTSRSLQPS